MATRLRAASQTFNQRELCTEVPVAADAMAHAYTTKRGKTKKAKMGIRKDNKQNQEQGLKSNTQLLEHALFDDKPAFGLHALVQTNHGIQWTAIPLPCEY